MVTYSKFSDPELLALLKAGDTKAFDHFYWKFHQPVYKNILKLTKDTEASQDLLQEVFAALWNKRDTLDESQPVGNWLFRVSFNMSINFTKKRLKELLLIRPIQEDDDVMEPFEVAEAEGQYHLLNQALQKLSPQKRRVFELCKLEGKTYEQTATEMNISKHTVKEYLTAALVFVKKFIHDHPAYSETALFVLLINYMN